jgi:cytochrome c oxidase subunit 2
MMRALFIVLLMMATATVAGSAVRAQSAGPRVIEVTAERFEFWPPQITIDEGETVVIHVRSDDTQHGFRLVGTGTNVTVPKRGKGVAMTTLTGLKAGRYTFECSRLCGAGHNFMRGVLIVRAADGRQP